MDQAVREIRAEDINPRFNWGRALPALGIMGVDFEERVDYRRLHRYRLARTRMALEKSDLGALLVMDVNNIRYLTSTKIGEWERDKICRWALLTRGSADPMNPEAPVTKSCMGGFLSTCTTSIRDVRY